MRFLLLLCVPAAASCGSRTDVGLELQLLQDASVDGRTDAPVDAPIDVGRDVIVVTDAGCSTDSECADKVACSLDRCDPNLHVCTHAAQDNLCDDGLFCTDNLCDVNTGCASTPKNCADAIACTNDGCNEGKKQCEQIPDDSKCPISHTCDPILGCQARALAHDQTTLYDIRIPSGQAKVIGPTKTQLTDIALHPNNTLYGIAFGALYTVNQQTGNATLFKSLQAMSLNGADVNPNNNVFYVSGGTALYALDPQNGTIAFAQSFPNGRTSSGDLAFIGARMVGTANGQGGDDLVEFDLANKTAKVLGPVGYSCVWGLAAYGMTLYGLTCEGRILSIDTNSGKGSQLNQIATQFWGASAR